MNIFVSNLSFHTTEEDLTTLFSKFGDVKSSKIIVDRETNRSRGFGFVEMAEAEQAKAAIQALHNKDIEGRLLNVSEARPKSTGTGSYRNNKSW